jgi:hypothetical protein
MDKKEKRMASLGARILSDNKAGVESAETTKLRLTGEASILANIVDNVEAAYNKSIEWFLMFAGVDGEARLNLNRDFFAERLSPQALSALIASWQSGAIAHVDLVDAMVQGEVLSSERTSEQILEDVDNTSDNLGEL